MWIVSQVIGVFSIVLWIIIYQQKNKARQLGLSAIGNTISVVSSIFLFNFVKVGAAGVSAVKNATFAYSEKTNKFSPETLLSLVILFSWVSLIVMFYTWLVWIDWLILATIFVFNYGKAFGNIHWVKVPGLVYNGLFLVNSMMFMSITGIISHTLIMISIIVYYIRRYKEKRKRAAQPSQAQELPSTDASSLSNSH